jgi:flavin reductase (DIM6/NTAB) family NADH-FMN oxidoreductase RutF
MPASDFTPPDARQFREAMGLFATGVAVVAAHAGDEVHGMTANSVTSVSLEPMLLLFCPAKQSRLAQVLGPGVPFSVNFLRADQQAISVYFAGRWREAEPPPFHFAPLGAAPGLVGSLASIACQVRDMIDGGDHWVVIGDVLHLQQGAGQHEPLLFYRGRYRQVDLAGGAAAPDLSAVTNEPVHVHYEPEA